MPGTLKRPGPLPSILAGVAGTAVLSLLYGLEHRLRPEHRGPLDYDDSLVPGEIVVNILHLPSVTQHEEWEVGEALRWTYGSFFGLGHGLTRRLRAEPGASVIFAATLMGMTLTMFPLLGRTPPPWRWPRGYLLTSLLTHAAYAATVGAVDAWLRHEG